MYEILFLLVSVFQTYEFYLILGSFFDVYRKNVQKHHVFLWYMLFYAVTVAENYFINIPIVNTGTLFFSIFLLTFLYKTVWKKRLLSIVFVFVMMLMTESIVAGVFGYVDAALFGVQEYYSYVGMVCLPIVQFLLVLLFRNINNLRKKIEVPLFYWIVTILLPITTVYLYIQISRQSSISQMDLICCTVVIFVINIFVIFFYDLQIKAFTAREEKKVLETQSQGQEKQLELMTEATESLRRQRHDFRNHLSSLAYYGKEKDWGSMEQYLSDLQIRLPMQQEMIATGNMAFDSVLNYKKQMAREQGIDMRIDIRIPQDIGIASFDITTILANLLDNSLEAVQSLEAKWIAVKIFMKHNRLNIQIDNPYGVAPVKKNGKFVTSKSEKKMHGYGMQNVEAAVERYEGQMNIDMEGQIFSVKITMFL